MSKFNTRKNDPAAHADAWRLHAKAIYLKEDQQIPYLAQHDWMTLRILCHLLNLPPWEKCPSTVDMATAIYFHWHPEQRTVHEHIAELNRIGICPRCHTRCDDSCHEAEVKCYQQTPRVQV